MPVTRRFEYGRKFGRIATANCFNGQWQTRCVVRADEKLTAFLELQKAIHAFAVDWV